MKKKYLAFSLLFSSVFVSSSLYAGCGPDYPNDPDCSKFNAESKKQREKRNYERQYGKSKPGMYGQQKSTKGSSVKSGNRSSKIIQQ